MDNNRDIPYVVLESQLARDERHIKRLMSIIIILILFWFLTIGTFVWYITLPVETYSEVSQDINADENSGTISQNIGDSYGESKTN